MLAKSKSADVWSCKGRKRILSDGEKDAVLGICSGAGMYIPRMYNNITLCG